MDLDLFEHPEKNCRGKRHYVGTKNNYTDDDINQLEAWGEFKCSYLCYGKEVGEKTGTPHLQIYMEFENTKSMSAICKKLFPMWLGYRKGSAKQAAGYCKKGQSDKPPGGYESYYDEPHDTWDGKQFGELSQQGKRTDIDNPVSMLVEDGATMKEVARQYPVQFVKYHKGFQALRTHMLEPRSLDCMPEVIWLWGPTGTGKTRDAYIKHWPDEPHYVWKPSNGNWWDGYDGQKKIIIDEFRAQMTWSDILGLLDRNEYRAPIKGGFAQIQADKFVITSPFPPDQCYKSDDRYDRVTQLLRRVTTIISYPLQVKYAPDPWEL